MLLHRDEIGNSIFYGTNQEQDELGFVAKYLQPRMVFFDLGANQGLYSILASHKVGCKGYVYAFEPARSEYSKLRQNVWFNLAWNITTEQIAVGSFDGTAQMFACESRKGSYSSLVYPAVDTSIKVTEITVPIVSLDSYIIRHKIGRIDYLKMDVEGAERDVLEGGKWVFSTGPRPIVQCEFSDRRTGPWGYQAREIADMLVNNSYAWFEPVPGGLREHKIKDHYDYDDLVAVPQEKLDMVSAFLL